MFDDTSLKVAALHSVEDDSLEKHRVYSSLCVSYPIVKRLLECHSMAFSSGFNVSEALQGV